jgi:uncharacterized protein (TIGR00661 family)
VRILYGICGIGMGHATRSRVSIEHLASRGHQVLACASQAGCEHVTDARGTRGVHAVETAGVVMRTKDGRIDLRGMLDFNLPRLLDMLVTNGRAWRDAEKFAPEAVVTDHDSFAWMFGKAKELPIMSIDNSQVIARCAHSPSLVREHLGGLRVLAARTAGKVPGCDRYVITSFFFPPVLQQCATDTELVFPVLRRSVLVAASLCKAPLRSPSSSHVLVYKTLASSPEDAQFFDALSSLPSERFVIYGLEAGTPVPQNCVARPIDEDAFVRDLASAKAVIGNGGMSLMGEALALGKPVLAIPIQDQYEQVLNALYLECLGFGRMAAKLDASVLTEFLANASMYAARIRSRPQHDGNQKLYALLDAFFSPGLARPTPR